MNKNKIVQKDSMEITMNIYRFRDIFKTGIMEDRRNILHYSAFMEIIVILNDLLLKAKKQRMRIDFSDDIIKMNDPFYSYNGKMKEIDDITDTVKFFRDSMCHIESKNRYISSHINLSFCIIAPCGHSSLKDNEKEILLDNPYQDDVAYYYGPQRLYIKRHIIRALNEVVEKFTNNYDLFIPLI